MSFIIKDDVVLNKYNEIFGTRYKYIKQINFTAFLFMMKNT